MASTALVGDIGGTNSRFALARDGVLLVDSITAYPTAAFPSLAQAAQHYLDTHDVSVDRSCIAIAGPVAGDLVRLTNHPWQFSIEQTRAELGLQRLRIINDFQAVGLALPHLRADQLVQIGGDAPRIGEPRVALGPGTGYGATHVITVANEVIALPTEGGHISIAPSTALELNVCEWLLRRDAQIICEHLLSGPGLENIYRALASTRGNLQAHKSAAEIQHSAVENTDELSVAALNLFCELLGTAARDQALSSLARGGIYIAGGIVQRFIPFFRASGFRARFELSPTMHDVLVPIPVYIITDEFPGLVGAAAQCR
ncbi:MAG: glucokinase [Verrucomicrobiaceae bacterium]|nr:glucokinase [Verrucomicrobiaceae bacterium]